MLLAGLIAPRRPAMPRHPPPA
uniref:Uncharacterized protein n=1 Tax=Arundo donax TaxID=35708 RepID=A0A0A9HSQ5_ARUDO